MNFNIETYKYTQIYDQLKSLVNQTRLYNSIECNNNSKYHKKLILDTIRSFRGFLLRSACKDGYLKVAKYVVGLIRKIAGKKARDIILDDIRAYDNNLLHLVCLNGNLKIIKFLINLGLTFND